MLGRVRASRRSITAAALGVAALLGLSVTPVAASDFPTRDSRYHSYSEMVSDIRAVEAAHPSIVHVFSIGKSYQGRNIWAAKVSDNVGTDESEPEILFDALHHAREHLTVEQALYLLHVLADGYGSDSYVTSLVNTREIWIVFAVNPDGFEYDLTCTGSADPPYCAWRKNRQPNAGTSAIGTDLNRNYDYRWGCCGGSSSSPASILYRGSSAFSAPETRALRDFVLSRVINGVQQIKAHITLHTNGQLVLWPYGHTYTDIPADMTAVDHQVFVALGKGMAARNGYTPEQSSDLYITDGDQIDWMYGRQRIFSFTWELYPLETPTVWGDHYPADEQIAAAVSRNRTALLYLISEGGCPYGIVGLAKFNCGPFFDDMEIRRGWTVNPDATDTASASGRFTWGDPHANFTGKIAVQPETTSSGRYAFVTGLAGGSTPNTNDLDGVSTIRSPWISLPSAPGPLSWRYFWGHGPSDDHDSLAVWVENGTGVRTLAWAVPGTALTNAGSWKSAAVSLSRWAGQKIRIIVQAKDRGADSLVEAGVDDIRVQQPG
jgi:hypothetical protein